MKFTVTPPRPSGRSRVPLAARRRVWPLAVFAALSALQPLRAGDAPAPAPVAELTLEQLMDLKVERVYGASRIVQKVTQAPSSVSIVSADDISRHGWRTLTELLQSVRGLYLFDDDNYSYLGARGFLRPGDYNTRVLLLVDGHRMNDNIYDAFFTGREAPLDVALIDRVEIIRGPSSSIYGSSAFFGVLNVIPKRGAQLQGGSVSADLGSFGSREGSVIYGHKTGALDWVAAVSSFTSRGRGAIYYPEFDPRRSANPAAANRGVAQNLDAERVVRGSLSLAWRDFTFSTFASRRAKTVPTASFGTVFNDPREMTFDRRGYADLKFEHAFAPVQVLGRVFYDRYRYDGTYPLDYGLPDAFVARDSGRGEWVGTEWQLTATPSPQFTTLTGLEYRENLHEDQATFYDSPTDINDHRASRSLGVFAQGDFALRKELRFTGGLRYDRYYGSFGGTLNPRVGLIWSPSEVTTVKALFGRAFRAPNAYERYYYTEQLRRPALQPERIRTYELVWERYWAPRYRLAVSAYTYSVQNLIGQRAITPGELYFENVDSTRAAGGEIEFEAKYDSGWQARASLAHQRARDGAARTELTHSPSLLGKLNVSWAPASSRARAGLEVQHQSDSRTLGGARAAAFTLVHLHLATTRLPGGFHASLTSRNLFDTHYTLPAAEDHSQDVLAQRGRSLWFKLTREF